MTETAEIKQESNLISDKMRTTPIGKLLCSMSIPAITSMMVQALYNIVDSIYVSRLSDANNFAFDAISIVTPFCMIANSLAIAIGVGANIYISRKLGEKNQKDADGCAKTAVILCFICYALMAVLGATCSKAYASLYTDNPEILSYATSYATIYLCCSLGMFLELSCIRILQATGNMKIPMISQLVGAVTNIVLDPIFIFGYFGIPAMGVKGAAIATVIGQWFAATILVVTLVGKKQDVSLRFNAFKLKKDYFKGILAMGAPNFVMNIAFSFVNMAMNGIVGAYENGISVLNAQFKLQSFVYMPVFGLTQGGTPILSYNYGANNKSRFNHATRLITIWIGIILTAWFVVFQTMPHLLIKLFNPTEGMVELGIRVMRTMSISFIPAILSIVVTTVLQALNKPIIAMLMNITRQIAFVLLFAIVLKDIFGLNGIFFCYPIAETLATIIFLPFAVRQVKKQFEIKNQQYLSGQLG